MSESSANPPADSSGSTPPPRAVSKVRRWRRRLWRIFLVCVAIAIVMRIIVFFAIGPVMRKVAGAYGYDVSFQRQELMLLGGDVGLWYLKVTPRSGGQPLIQTDYIRGNVSILELLRGRLVVRRAEADGVDLTLERTAEGRIPLLDEFVSASGPPAAPPAARPPKPQPIDFTAPLEIEAFRLQHVRATIHDAAVTPPLRATVAMDVRVNSVGAHDRPTRFDIDIWSDPLLDSMRITGEGKSDRQHLNATMSVFIRGLHPGPLAGYLAPYGIRPVANSIAADLSATLKAEPAAAPSNGVKASLTLDRIRVQADEQDAAVLARIQVEADSIDSTAATLANLSMEGGRLYSRRTAGGFIQIAGLELSGGAEPAQDHAASPPAANHSPNAAYAVSIRQITIQDMIASLHDQAVAPANDLRVILARLATTAQQIDSRNSESVVPFEGEFSIPGVARTIALHGSVSPFAAAKAAQFQFDAQGIRLDALKPYLAAAGVESLLDEATAQGRLTASLRDDPSGAVAADAEIDGLKLAQGTDLVSMKTVRIGGAGIDPETGRLRFQSVAISGPRLEITRDGQGRLCAANLRWTPAAAPASSVSPESHNTAAASAPSSQPFNLAALPRLQIDHFIWDGLRIRLNDEQAQPASAVAIEEAGLEIKDLVFDLASPAQTKPGTLRGWLNSPQLARQVNIDGTIQPGANSLGVEVHVRAQGLQTISLDPYLKPLGVEPDLRDGSAQFDARAAVSQVDQKLNASLDLTDVSLQEAGAELGGIGALRVDGFSIDSSGMEIKAIHLQSPRVQVARETADSLTALGLRVKRPAASAPGAASSAASSGVPASAPSAAPLAMVLHDFSVADARIGWTDRTFEAPVQITGRADLQLSELAIGKPAPAARFHSVFSASGAFDEMVIDGKVDPNPDALALQADVRGRGIRLGALAAYLPPGMQLAAADGRIRASIDAGLAKNPQGGNSARFSVENVSWQDGPNGDPLLALDQFQITAPRIDMAGNVIAIDQVQLAGFQAKLTKTPDGGLVAAGVRFGPTTAPAVKSAQSPPSPPATAPAEEVAALIAQARRPLPLVTLQKLDIGVRKVTFHDLSRPAAAPAAIEHFQLRNTSPIELAGKEADTRPPVRLALSGRVSPMVENFTVDASLAPFAPEPAATLEIKSTGIRGDGLTDVLPELKHRIEGGKLTDGQFQTQLQAHLKFDRRGPRDFDLSRGFQLDLAVNGVEFRDRAGGDVIAGLESIRLEQARVLPKTGTVLAKSLEVAKPRLRAFRDADGVHVLGYVVPVKSAAGPSTQPAPSPSAPAAVEASSPATRPAGEIRIDQFVISGLDFLYQDQTVTPRFEAPLNGLDVEVRDLTTLALYEPRTIRFSAIVNAGKVPLPVYAKGAGIPGALGDLFASGQKAEPATQQIENRDLFSQVAVNGRLALYPRPGGYVKTSINGVELAGFRGPASQAGVELHGGVFDGAVDARFREDGTLETRSKLSVTDLQLAEPPEGPIARHLNLPAPLDAVIKALEAPDGSITIPLDIPIKAGQISGPAMTGAALGAISSVLITAVASAPIKVAGGVTDLVGLGALTGKDKKKPLEPVVLSFAPGSTDIEPQALSQLNDAIEQARRDKNLQLTLRHELGGADVALAAIRANPPADDALAMAQRLRTRKMALENQRSQVAGQLRGQLAVLPAAQNQPILAQLRSLDRQIAEVEASMDELYDLLRPGADRQALRRTRTAALQIARQRLDAVAAMIASSNLSDVADRVHPVAAQYNPTEGNQGGGLTITFTTKGQGGS